MAKSSILGGTHAPLEPAGRDVDALGPSDSSDSGSDMQTDLNGAALADEVWDGPFPIRHRSTTDSGGTGECASADPEPLTTDADLLPDRIAMRGSRRVEDDPQGRWTEDLAVDDSDEDDEDEET